jgi:hypothetical protein
MNIIKVFLAKSHLARGLDVEFIKSSLMKIANLAIIESGSRVKPSECEIFIYVPAENDFIDEQTLSVNKIISLKIENFVSSDVHKKHFFILRGINTEKEWVLCDRVRIDSLLSAINENYIPLEEYDDVGVDIIGELCNIFPHLNFSAIRKVSLRYTPSDNYALPPIPSIEKRMLGRFNMKNLDIHQKSSKIKKK